MFDNVRKVFSVRFEPDGDGYLFRPKLTAPGVRVTAAERDRFIADYVKAYPILVWGCSIGGSLLVMGVVAFFVFQDIDLPPPALLAMVVAIMAPIFFGSRWIYRAPDRALAGRPGSAPGYSEAAAKRITMKRLTWRNIGVGFAIMVVILVKILLGAAGKGQNPLQTDDRYWLILVGAGLALGVVQAFRKWRSERG